MNEDKFNMTVRKFLKEVGVTSQREIEKAVAKAMTDGRLAGVEQLDATVTLEVSGVELRHVVRGHVDLA